MLQPQYCGGSISFRVVLWRQMHHCVLVACSYLRQANLRNGRVRGQGRRRIFDTGYAFVFVEEVPFVLEPRH